MQKLKVCHLTSVHPCFDTRIFVKECCTLAKEGFEVHLVAPNAPSGNFQGVHLHGFPQGKIGRLQRMTTSTYMVYQNAIKIDAQIYHFHDSELIPVGLVLKIQGKKVIYDVHEDVPVDILGKAYIPSLLRSIISKVFNFLEKSSSRRFDAVVSATSFIRDKFLKNQCNAIAINNYPLLNELSVSNEDSIKEENSVCYVGGIWTQRGVFQMVEAIGKVDATLLLAGQFYSTTEEQAVATMEGWKNVKYFGQQNRNDVAQLMARSVAGLVVLHPIDNYLDSLPTKLFEYMSAGIPVIASNFSAWKNIVETYQCGICVDPLAPSEIADAIRWIMEHPHKAKEMGSNGRKAVEENYTWENEFKSLLKTYNALCRD